MLSKLQLRTIFLHEFKLGHNATDATQNIIKAWGKDITSDRTVRRWFEKFRNGNLSIEDEDRQGRHSTLDDDELKAVIESDPRKTTRQVSSELGVDQSTVVRHLELIGKVKKLDKWVPHELNEKQINQRFEVCSSLLVRHKNEPFLDRIVTCDEKWIVYDNRRRSAQWLDIDEPPKHFPKRNLHQKKVMVSVWWSAAGLIHYNFFKEGETIDSERYCNELEEMFNKLKIQHPALVNRKGLILLHDNARPHVSRMTLQKLYSLGIEILPHPPYSPDLSPTDYHFFKHLDKFLQDKIFNNGGAAKLVFEEFVASRKSNFYMNGINKLLCRWEKCVNKNGFYFD